MLMDIIIHEFFQIHITNFFSYLFVNAVKTYSKINTDKFKKASVTESAANTTGTAERGRRNITACP